MSKLCRRKQIVFVSNSRVEMISMLFFLSVLSFTQDAISDYTVITGLLLTSVLPQPQPAFSERGFGYLEKHCSGREQPSTKDWILFAPLSLNRRRGNSNTHAGCVDRGSYIITQNNISSSPPPPPGSVLLYDRTTTLNVSVLNGGVGSKLWKKIQIFNIV